MQKVLVKRDDLAAEIKSAVARIKAAHEKAMKKYRSDVVAACEKALKDAKAGKDVDRYHNIHEPSMSLSRHETVLKMLSMSIEDEIYMTREDFERVVMD